MVTRNCDRFSSPSSKYSDFAQRVDVVESSILSMDDIAKLENDATEYYTTEFLAGAVNTIVSLVTFVRDSETYSPEYPLSVSRLVQGGVSNPITNIEVADFLQITNTPTDTIDFIQETFDITTNKPKLLVTTLPKKTRNFLTNLETYYDDNMSTSITGGFCSKFSDILGKIFSLIDQVKNLTNAAASVIAQLQNVKDLLHSLVDQLKEKMLGYVSNMADTVAQFTDMAGFFSEKLMRLSHFFGDDSINELKNNIEFLISGTAGKFEEITPEVLQHLLFRFCQLSNIVESFMRSPIESMNSYIQNYQLQMANFQNISNQAMLDAIRAGGFRMDRENIEAMRRGMARKLRKNATHDVPSYGGGDDTRGMASPSKYYTEALTQRELALANEIKTKSLADINAGNYAAAEYIRFVNLGEGEISYKKIQVEALALTIRLSKRLNKRLDVTSGYRSPSYNAGIPGAAKGSYHMSGLALDITRSSFGSSFSEGERFIKYASQEGFGGIGTYLSFIHIDLGPRRRWGKSHTDTLSLHAQDKFRNGEVLESGQNSVPGIGTTTGPV